MTQGYYSLIITNGVWYGDGYGYGYNMDMDMDMEDDGKTKETS